MQTAFFTIRANFNGPADSENLKPLIMTAPRPVVVREIEIRLEWYMDIIEAALGGASCAADITYLPHGMAYSTFSNSDDVDYFNWDYGEQSYERGNWVLWNDIVHIPTYLDLLEEEYHPMQHKLSRHELVRTYQYMNTNDRLVFKIETEWPLLVVELAYPTVLVEGTIKIVYSSSITITGVEVGEAGGSCGTA